MIGHAAVISAVLHAASFFQQVRDVPRPATNVSDQYVLQCRIEFDLVLERDTTQAALTVKVPDDVPGEQQILSWTPNSPPRIDFENNHSRYEEFLVTGDSHNNIRYVDFDVVVATSEKYLAGSLTMNEHERYLATERGVIPGALPRALPSTRNVDAMSVAALSYTHEGRKYKVDGIDRGALELIRNGYGDCSEFADLYVSRMRGWGVPSRVWNGFFVYVTDKRAEEHSWAEYLSGESWNVVEATSLPEMAKGPTVPLYIRWNLTRSDELLHGHPVVGWLSWDGDMKGKIKLNILKINKLDPTAGLKLIGR